MEMKLMMIALAVIITGVASYFIAKNSGRNSMVWFLAGVIFSFLAVALPVFLKTLHVKILRRCAYENQK